MSRPATNASPMKAGEADVDEQVRDYQLFVRRRMRFALILAVGAALVLVLAGYKPEAKGVALGALFSIISFGLMARTLPARIQRQGRSGRAFGFVWILARLALLAVPLVVAGKVQQISLPAAAVGLFAIQATLYLEPLTSRLKGR